ncbi:hypothetical protein DM01DRAFT_1331224 [Hesseltinella vesiculosa]|uniref:Homeobox domain-containing protein n=1 Tax=Hesseltinella vesiculosa TaxID=101127 RepID=A0A1X2GYH7_9FUNG|nr:hypothetical protein DM01DRAFT_1331224 [Hesseltinella vesiculosa]
MLSVKHMLNQPASGILCKDEPLTPSSSSSTSDSAPRRSPVLDIANLVSPSSDEEEEEDVHGAQPAILRMAPVLTPEPCWHYPKVDRPAKPSPLPRLALFTSTWHDTDPFQTWQLSLTNELDMEACQRLIKAKRRRANRHQLQVLNQVFQRTFFPSTQLREQLGRQLGMSPRTVQIWFQNRRQALRTKERQQQVL